MKVHLLAQVHGNFGDKLNRWLWHGLLADVWSKRTMISWESGLGVDLEGQVVSGRGLAAAELLTLREQVQTIVQEPLCPGSLNIRLMRQALYLQTFRHYGIKPGPLDLPAFVRTGLHLRTLKKLAGIYLRKA